MPPQQPTFAEPEAGQNGPRGGFIPARDARDLMDRQKRLNGAKRPAYIPNAIKKESDELRLYIFNVGPKRQAGNGASYGSMIIPACPDGREYSDALVVPGLPHEMYNREGNVLDVQFHGDGDIEDPGYDFACQVIGGYTDSKGQWNGKFLDPKGSLERFGVGICRSWPPSKADVEMARRKMAREDQLMINQANEAHAIGRFSQISTPDHYLAAHRLKKTVKDCPWLVYAAEATVAEDKPLCPKCRHAYEVGTVQHDCGFILDKKQYDEWVTKGLIAK